VGAKLLDEDGNLLYEFGDELDVATLFPALLTRAKFSDDRFDPLIVFNEWIYDFHKALQEKKPAPKSIPREQTAPKYHLDAGMTQSDWDLQNFFTDFQIALKDMLPDDWHDRDYQDRANYIRMGLYPNEISDQRLKDMIEEVDWALQRYAQHHNPNYSNNG